MSHDTPISAPKLPTPPGACDTHIHVYEPGYEMRPGGNRPSQPGTLAHYRLVKQQLGLARTVIVQPSAYGTDNACTVEAIRKLGDDARGVAIVDPAVSDEELARLDRSGIRGVRYHMRSSVVSWDSMPEMAARVAPLGWHVQLQCASHELAEREAVITKLPCGLVVDHMGRFDHSTPETDRSWRLLLRLLATGRCWVKLSGPYYGSKSGPPLYADKARIAKALIKAAPERMVWASNWPHPSFKNNFPDEGKLLDTLAEWTAGDEKLRRRILVDNPAKLYGF
jgi:D-galactarolactone isomerase